MGDEGVMHLNVTMSAAAAWRRARRDREAVHEGHRRGRDAAGDRGTAGATGAARGRHARVGQPRPRSRSRAIPHRVTLEELEERYPNLVPTLLAHPGVAFVLVRSRERGAGRDRQDRHALPRERAQSRESDPLAPFGPNAAAKALRTDGFPHVADIMVNSTYWADLEEVAAFEELVGSHGGMGGPQQYPFLLAPAEFAVPDELMLGPGTVHDSCGAGSPTSGTSRIADERAARSPLRRAGRAWRFYWQLAGIGLAPYPSTTADFAFA